MRFVKALSLILAVCLLAACGGSNQQQADATQPAPAQDTPATASTEPAQPAAPAQEPAPYRQQPPAQRPSGSTASHSAPAPAQAAPAAPSVHMVSVPAGTVISLALDSGINSKTAQVGDAFTATVVEPIAVEGRDVIPAGSKIEGKVTEAVAAKRGAGKARLALSFDTLTLSDGYRTNIVGTFQEVTKSKKGKNAAIIGGSAAGGALLGRILGKDTKGAVIGAIVGGGVGTAVVMGKEGEQAKLPADTPFEIKLEEAVQVPHEASRS
jgi:type IV secretion system protein VirB10